VRHRTSEGAASGSLLLPDAVDAVDVKKAACEANRLGRGNAATAQQDRNDGIPVAGHRLRAGKVVLIRSLLSAQRAKSEKELLLSRRPCCRGNSDSFVPAAGEKVAGHRLRAGEAPYIAGFKRNGPSPKRVTSRIGSFS
jgi:hypothetical protein